MYFALVKNGIVDNIIVADQEFVNQLTAQYDYILDVSQYEITPQIGWEYDSEEDTCIVPEPIVSITPPDIL